MDGEARRKKLGTTAILPCGGKRDGGAEGKGEEEGWWKKMEGKETEEAHEGSSACMAASSTYRLPLTGCTIAIASTFFAPPPTCLSSTRILHLQGGVTLKTLPVLNYSVPLSFSLSSSSSSTSFYSSRFFCFFSSANFFTSITPLSLSSPLGFCLDTPFPVVVSCFFFFFYSSFYHSFVPNLNDPVCNSLFSFFFRVS